MKRIPFNVFLLVLTPQNTQGIKPVRSLDIFEGSSSNFHEDGLFSVSIFGRVGDELRSKRVSYIDLKTSVLHPIILRALVSLKRLYGGIISGSEYARWNDQENDFERASPLEGKTGFAFFLEHWKKIKFTDTKSISREQRILLLQRYKDEALLDKLVVMPAGMRDIEIDNSGRVQEDEINSLYRTALKIANSISDAAVKNNQELIDGARYSLQSVVIQIYELLESMVEGKKKLIMGRWASRRIHYGTRNVITAMNTSTPYLGAPGSLGFNHTQVGLYQMMKAAMPLARFHLKAGFLSKVFPGQGLPANLVNKKSLKMEQVQLKSEYYSRWMTDEGLEKIITMFGDAAIRHRELIIEDHYVGLIYKAPGVVRVFQDIDELPENFDKANVHPLTFAELMYISTYRVLNTLPVFVTRYPVTGMGSIYASFAYVKTTLKGDTRTELDETWQKMPDDAYTALEFPIAGDAFMDSLVPHSAKLVGLGADFDGDTGSGNVVMADESIAEVREYMGQTRAYLGTDGRFMSSVGIDTVKLVLYNMTGPVA